MNIAYEEFQKMDLRVSLVIAVERVEGSEKLLKLEVDLGEEQRQIIAGIGRRYNPEDLLGKRILIIANLEPRTIMGLESQGMVLAAIDSDDLPVVLFPEREVPSGSHLR